MKTDDQGGSKDVVKILRIIKYASKVCLHGKDPLRKTSRKEYALCRHIISAIAYKHTELSMAQIGYHLGGKDHATVRHSCVTARNLNDTDASFKTIYDNVEALYINHGSHCNTFEDAIKDIDTIMMSNDIDNIKDVLKDVKYKLILKNYEESNQVKIRDKRMAEIPGRSRTWRFGRSYITKNKSMEVSDSSFLRKTGRGTGVRRNRSHVLGNRARRHYC